MIDVKEATEHVLTHSRQMKCEDVSIHDALGRVLAEDFLAVDPLPRWDNSAMDGYAVRAEDTPGQLTIVQELFAGDLSSKSLLPGQAARIFTGAPIPKGCDAVEMQENTERTDSSVSITRKLAPWANIRRRGEDTESGALVVKKGSLLHPGEMAAIAAFGVETISCYKKPRVAILPTGDELALLGTGLERGQIYNSNAVALAALVHSAGAIPVVFPPVKDSMDDTVATVREALDCDAVITTGGVSVGEKDFVQEALKTIGADIIFWKVAIKPGKPLLFSTHGDTPIFGLPGNPVSTMITFELFVLPCLRQMRGETNPQGSVIPIVLESDYKKSAGRAHYLPAKLVRRGPDICAALTTKKSSGMVSAMANVDCLVVFPATCTEAKAGSVQTAILLGCKANVVK